MHWRKPAAEPTAPAVIVRRERPKLRILCTEITPYRQLIERARRDLGFDLEFEAHDFVSAQRIAATQPDRYDVYDQCFHDLDIVWYWRAIKPTEIDRIELWGEVNDLTKKGTISIPSPSTKRLPASTWTATSAHGRSFCLPGGRGGYRSSTSRRSVSSTSYWRPGRRAGSPFAIPVT
jgi:hypothetical protein